MKDYIKKMTSNLLLPSNTLSQSLAVWEHLIGPIYSWHAIIVITCNVGLGGELPAFVGYWDHFNTAFIRNGQHVAFILPLTNNNIITPFPHRLSFLQLFFYNIFEVSFAITTESSTDVCFLLYRPEDAWQALQNCENCLQTLNILFPKNYPSVWGQFLQFVLSHECQGTANHCR